MKSNSYSVTTVLISFFIYFLLLEDALAARGGSFRGGSFRGGSSYRGSYYSSGSSSRYSSRYSWTRVSSSGSYSRMSIFVYQGFPWSVKYRAFRNGYYLNSLVWRRSHSDLREDTSICFNIQDSLPDEYNSSVQVPWIYQNRTTFGVFVCPLDGQSDKTYCCGDDGAESCCTFWDDSSRVAGVVIAIIVALLILVIVIYKIIKCSSCTPSSCSNNVSDTPVSYDNRGVSANISSSSSSSSSTRQKAAGDQPPPYPGNLDPQDGNFSNLYGNSYHGNEDWIKPPPLPQYPDGTESRPHPEATLGETQFGRPQ